MLTEPITLTSEEQRLSFKVGTKVKIRPDGDLYTGEFVEDMIGELGKNGEVIGIFRYTNRNAYFSEYTDGDYAIMVATEDSKLEGGWQWHYKSLLLPSKTPDYSPRKIVRESNQNFKYNCIVFKSNNDEESLTIQKSLMLNGYSWFGSGTKFKKFDYYPIYFFADANDNDITYSEQYSNQFSGGRETIDDYIKRFNEERDNNICTTIFKADDAKFIKNITTTGFVGPTYNPRKIVRESIENYKYDSVVFKANNPSENSIIQTSLFENGYHWSYTKKLEVRDFEEYPIYFFAETQDVQITYSDRDSEGSNTIGKYISDCNEEGDNICTTVFKASDAKHIKNILKIGTVGPSYQPRKIVRESISYNLKNFNTNFKNDTLLIKVENNEELKTANELLKEFGLDVITRDMIMTDDDSRVYPLGLFVTKFDNMVTFYSEMEERNIEYFKETENIYDTIFTIDDLSKIKSILLFGSIGPDYSPKKIIRESNNYNHGTLVLHARTNYEVRYLQEQLFSIGFQWSGGEGFLKLGNEELIILCHIKNKELSFLNALESYTGRKKLWDKEFNTDGIIYTVNDWHTKLVFLLKGQIPLPSYEPRKIIRESIDYKYSKIVVHLTSNEEVIKFQEHIFSLNLGFRWISTSTPRVLFDDDTEMVIVLDLKQLRFLYYLDLDDYNSYGFNITMHHDPKIYTYQDLNRIDDILLSSGRPSYKPRKIIREFESFGNKEEEIYKISFRARNREEGRKIQEILFENGYKWQSGLYNTIHYFDYPILFFVNFKNNNITQVGSTIIENSILSKQYPSCYHIIYNMETLDNYLTIIKRKSVKPMPSYAPRKIDRSFD